MHPLLFYPPPILEHCPRFLITVIILTILATFTITAVLTLLQASISLLQRQDKSLKSCVRTNVSMRNKML